MATPGRVEGAGKKIPIRWTRRGLPLVVPSALSTAVRANGLRARHKTSNMSGPTTPPATPQQHDEAMYDDLPSLQDASKRSVSEGAGGGSQQLSCVFDLFLNSVDFPPFQTRPGQGPRSDPSALPVASKESHWSEAKQVDKPVRSRVGRNR